MLVVVCSAKCLGGEHKNYQLPIRDGGRWHWSERPQVSVSWLEISRVERKSSFTLFLFLPPHSLQLACFLDFRRLLRLQQSAIVLLHDDICAMASKITPRLWSQIWESANPFPGSQRCSQSRQFMNPRSAFTTSISRRAFSWSRPRLQQKGSPSQSHSIIKSFTPCGILFIDLSPAATVSPTITTCATNVEKSLFSTTTIPRRSITSLAQQAWRREIHSSTRRRQRGYIKRNKSSISNGQNNRKPIQDENAKAASKLKESQPAEPDHSANSYLHLPSLPKMPHRPTKEELLAAASGFWSRLKVRFKWFSIRSTRPWNIDDWSAFVSWFVLGNIVWILVGTTTFFSLVILSINTVVAQGTTSRFHNYYRTNKMQKLSRDGLEII